MPGGRWTPQPSGDIAMLGSKLFRTPVNERRLDIYNAAQNR